MYMALDPSDETAWGNGTRIMRNETITLLFTPLVNDTLAQADQVGYDEIHLAKDGDTLVVLISSGVCDVEPSRLGSGTIPGV
jgi:hypothetical protein